MPNWYTVQDNRQASDVSVTFIGGDSVVFDLGVTFRSVVGAWRNQPRTRIVIRCYDNDDVTIAERSPDA